MSLATDYRPKTWDDVTEQSVVVDILQKMCEGEELSNRNFLLIGPAGCGKAQPLYSKVLTPSGFIRMSDVHLGTEIITGKGNLTKVIGVYPQGVRPIYEIKLHGGSSIRVSDEHLNVFYTLNPINYERMDWCMTTNDLIRLKTDLDVKGRHIFIDYAFELANVASVREDYIAHLCRSEKLEARYIESIEYVGDQECQCIMVEHSDHTYVSDDYIPTHNTTLARICASVLNSGLGEPIEVDAASHGGVESVRELVNQAKMYPVGCKWKVFIIDEAHAISAAGWSSFLKCIEEGPARSVFLFATTNPEKIPETILSRVQTFQLSKISATGIYDRLRHVIDCENAKGANIHATEDALHFLAKLADGGMRNALTLLDKALAYSHDITSESLVSSLNLPNYDDYFLLLGACAKKDNAAIAEIVDRVYNSGVNYVKWFDGFLSFVMNIVKYILLQDIEATMIPAHFASKLSAYSTAHLIVCLKLSNRLVEMNRELKTTQYLQELTLAYLCTAPKK